MLLLLLTSLSLDSFCQNDFISQAVRDYYVSSERILQYEQIDVAWKMNGRIQAELNEGINNLLESNYGLAEANFDEVLRQDSGVWQARYYRGISRKLLTRLNDAKEDIQRVAQSNHAVYECYIELGRIHYLNKSMKDAERSFEKAVKYDPAKPIAYYLKGNLKIYQQEFKDAAKQYNNCILRDSTFSDAHVKLALLKVMNKEKNEVVLQHLDRVLRLDSLNRHALIFRVLFSAKDKQEQNLQDLNTLVRLSPDNLMPYVLRGILHTEMGDFARAFPDFNKVIEATYESENKFVGKQTWLDKKIDIQNAGAYVVSRVYGLDDKDGTEIKKAYCLMVIGNYKTAMTTLNACPIRHKEPICLLLLAIANEHQGDHESAFKYYDRALALDNDILDAHKKRAIYEQEMKQWTQSVADLSYALKLNPETFSLYKLRAVSYFYEGNLVASIADFSRFIQRDTTDQNAYESRGVAYQRNGQLIDAALDFAHSGNTDFVNFRKLQRAVDSLFHKTDTVTALSYLNRLVSALPNFTEGHVMRVRMMLKKNDWASIERTIDSAVAHRRENINALDNSFILTIKAMVSARSKRYEEALEVLNEAIKYDNKNSLAFFERGKILLDTGKNNKGITDLKKAESLGHKPAQQILVAMQ